MQISGGSLRFFLEAGVKQEYDWVIENFDNLLQEHGYVREGKYYSAEKANNDTLVFSVILDWSACFSVIF